MTDVEVIKEILAVHLEENKEFINKAVKAGIKEHVNGKIDSMHDKLDKHILEITPFLQGIKGLKAIRSLAVWIAGTVVTIGSAILIFKNLN